MVKLYQHQQKLLDQNPDNIGIFFGTGTGKSCVAIKLAEQKGKDTLIVCPKSIKENWYNEIDKFGDGKVGFLVKTKEEFKRDLVTLPGKKTLILDEAHYMSGLKSQLHKATINYIHNHGVEHIYPMTATPYMATCWSVFALGKILKRDWKWHNWNRAFFNEVRLGRKPPAGQKDRRRRIWTQKAGIEDKIAAVVNKLGVTARLEDLFDVPEQIFLTEYFDLTREQIKGMEEVVELQPIVEFTKYHQICGGTLKGDGYTPDRFFKSEKLLRVIDLCKENKKIAIVCRYNNELHLIASKIKNRKIFIINGATKNKQLLLDEINSRADAIVLIQGATSEGYSLWSVPIMVFYSLDFSWKNYWQLLGRIQRANHLKKNVYIILVTKNSIDIDVRDCILAKKNFHDIIYNKKLTNINA